MMKKLKRPGYKSRWMVSLLAGFLLWGNAEAQYYEKSRHISKAFSVEGETEIQVSNKYGTVNLMPWDKDSVRFEIDLVVKAKKESKVDKVFNYIDFNFTSTKYYIIAQTEINKSTFWTEISDAASALFSSDNKAEIDYTVYYPKGNPLKITNKFGNIYTTDHYGKLDIQLSNGNFKAHDLLGESDIRLEFGNASINRMNKGRLGINYSEINLEKAESITLTSKSSTFNLNEISELIVDSRRDKFFIKKIERMTGESSFTNFRVDQCSNTIILKMEYGEVYVQGAMPAFNLLQLNAQYTDIQIGFPTSVAYDLEIEHDKRTIISYPENYENLEQEVKDPKEELYMTYGRVGKTKTNAAKVKISNSAGTITIKPQ